MCQPVGEQMVCVHQPHVGLPLQAHMCLVEELGGQHAQTIKIIIYVRFLKSITRSQKLAVQFLLQKTLRNMNTINGKNVDFIQRKTAYPYDVLTVKQYVLNCELKFCEIKTEDKWRAEFIR